MVTGAPVTSVTGADIVELGARLRDLLQIQPRAQQLASGGYFDLASMGGSGFAPNLAREQLNALRLDAERQYGLDVQRFGLSYAQTAFQQKLDAGAQQLQKLALQTQLKGPEDWLRYNYVMNNAPGAPAPTVGGPGQEITPPSPTVGAGAPGLSFGGAGGSAGGSLTPEQLAMLPPAERAAYMAAEWNRTHPADSTRPEAQLGAAGIRTAPYDFYGQQRGQAGVQHWDPQRGWITTPDQPKQGGFTFNQQTQQWTQDAPGAAAQPTDSQPDVSGIQGQGWTPQTYTDTQGTPGNTADDVQRAGGHTWDPNATGPVYLAFGGRSEPMRGGMHAAVIGDPQRRGEPNPELAMSSAPIFVKPLKGSPKAQRMAQGAPRFATGGIVENAPFVSKALSGGAAFGQRGEALGPYGTQPLNYTNLLRLLPSEQAMTQGYIETPVSQGGLGGWFADEYERARRTGFQGGSTGVSTYG